MTRSFDPAHPGFTDGLFRPADHVLVVPQGSAIAILDLELGFVYATTPYGAESWARWWAARDHRSGRWRKHGADPMTTRAVKHGLESRVISSIAVSSGR